MLRMLLERLEARKILCMVVVSDILGSRGD